VALGGNEPEQALLQDRIALVPEGEGEAEDLVAVAEAGEPVLAPSVCLAPGPVVREVVPGVPVAAVVFADGAPGSFCKLWPPSPPARMVVGDLTKTGVLGRADNLGHGVILLTLGRHSMTRRAAPARASLREC